MTRPALAALFVLLCGSLLAATPPPAAPERSAIFFVADGLGPAQLSLVQLVDAHLQIDNAKNWGSISIASLDSPAPDTAAACTALATGHRSRNGLVSVDAAGNKLETLLEAAHQAGKLTGIVTNLPVTHASVSGFAAHLAKRDDELAVALQYVSGGPDVILGGGAEFFLPSGTETGRRQDGQNLLQLAGSHGYRVVRNAADLQTANGQGKLLGLFSSGAMAYEIDRAGENPAQPSLADLTRSALSVLAASPRGFVLVVNAGHLDWSCHDHDLAAASSEMLAMDAAVGVAMDFTKSHPQTVLVLAGSHETSGLAIAPEFHAAALHDVRASLTKVAAALRKDRLSYEKTLSTLLGWTELKTDEKEAIVLNADPAHPPPAGATDPLVLALGHIMEKRVGIAWATLDHTGVACPVAAAGIGADRFAGSYENAEVPRRIAHLLNLTLP